jgi:NADPH:quinone reductase-like Zn-dependent oxidoreductase
MRSGWGEVNYPQVVGHEIVGTIAKAGKNVKGIKVAAHYHSCSDMVSSCPFLRLGIWSVSVPRVTLAALATHAQSTRSSIVLKVWLAPTPAFTSAVRAKGTRHMEE